MPTRRVLLATLVLAGLAAGLPAHAVGSLVEVQIVDRSLGQALPIHRYRDVPYVAGQPGHRYAVQMVNRTAARVLVVLSVDGVNAVTGEAAAADQAGYVLEPYVSAEITGWRKNLSEAAAFYFTSLADSYAARTDRPANVGVVGVAVFRERAPHVEPHAVVPPWTAPGGDASSYAQLRKERSSNPGRPAAAGDAAGSTDAAADAGPSTGAADEAVPSAGAARESALPSADAPRANAALPSTESLGALALRRPAPAAAERLGTGHGEREHAPVTYTAFDRASSRPAEVVRVRYDSHANLVAMGVIRGFDLPGEPQPFARFAPDPR